MDPDRYVRENRDDLLDIIKHSDDEFTRALALVFLTKFGDEPDLEDIQREIEAAKGVVG